MRRRVVNAGRRGDAVLDDMAVVTEWIVAKVRECRGAPPVVIEATRRRAAPCVLLPCEHASVLNAAASVNQFLAAWLCARSQRARRHRVLGAERRDVDRATHVVVP
jgi:hypothetical protein